MCPLYLLWGPATTQGPVHPKPRARWMHGTRALPGSCLPSMASYSPNSESWPIFLECELTFPGCRWVSSGLLLFLSLETGFHPHLGSTPWPTLPCCVLLGSCDSVIPCCDMKPVFMGPHGADVWGSRKWVDFLNELTLLSIPLTYCRNFSVIT